MMVQPNKVVMQALTTIQAGEEITVAYQELPLEMLSPNLVRVLHMRSGAIANQLGCRCEICRLHLQDEAEGLADQGKDSEAGRDVVVNMSSMWLEATAQRIKLDERLRTYVMAMINDSNGEEGMLASGGMRMYYEHYLAPPPLSETTRPPPNGDDGGDDEEAPVSSFCPDLAFVLADIYCRCIIHFPGQELTNYLFWTALYNDLLRRTAINMPKTLTDALGARCYAALLICASLDKEDTQNQRMAFDIFMQAWLMLRVAHATMFKHTAYLIMLCKAYPNIGQVVLENHDFIKHKELRLQMEQVLKQKQDEAAHMADIARRAEVQASLSHNLPPTAEDALTSLIVGMAGGTGGEQQDGQDDLPELEPIDDGPSTLLNE